MGIQQSAHLYSKSSQKKGVKKMDLKPDPKCYTDVCIEGKWYHYDHCGKTAYMLKGGEPNTIHLSKEPTTEKELISLLKAVV